MFAPRRDRTLSKILVALIVIGVAAVGAFRAWTWFAATEFSPTPSASPAKDLKDARDLLAQGNLAEARRSLQPMAASTPEAAILLAQAEQQAGNMDEAKRLLERASNDFASSPDYPKLAIAHARLIEDMGSPDDAARLYQEVHDKAPRDIRAPATTGLGRLAERNKDSLKARDLYREAFNDAPWDSADWHEALDALGRVNVALLFSPQETPESKSYTVGKGDSITSIGNALNTTQGLLMRANGIDENTVLSMGRRLKYTPKDFRIVIERSRCRLFLLDKDGIFKCYAVGLGMPGHETTLGSYKIGNKEKNPIWHKPGAGPIPAGDPNNQLGTRWMPLVPDQEGLPKDLGIHGTISPETVGKFSSNGCTRLLPEQVEELYDLVVRSTPVDIVDTFSPEKIRNAESPTSDTTTRTQS